MIATEWELENLCGIVYIFINKINWKRYVGISTNSFYQRYDKNLHRWYQFASNKHFKNALLKYGAKNFIIQIVEVNKCLSELLVWENYYVLKFRSNNSKYGYNKTSGGDSNFVSNRRKTTEEFIARANKIHGDKYDYSSTIYEGVKKKLQIFCINCEKYFWQRADRHLSGKGCRFCGLKSMSEKTRKPFNMFLDEAYIKYGLNYLYCTEGYSLVMDKIKIKHIQCGSVFLQSPYHHIHAITPCPKCNPYVNSKINKNICIAKHIKNFIKKARMIHGEKYDYTLIKNIDSKSKLTIICNKCKNIFRQNKRNHLKGQYGCPKCSISNKGLWKAGSYEAFLNKSREKFGDRFEYVIINEPFRMAKKIQVTDIICNKTYLQDVREHLSGNGGCPTCKSLVSKTRLSKGIRQINLSTGLIQNEFISSKDAMKETGINDRKIRFACQHEIQSHGFMWKYIKCNK